MGARDLALEKFDVANGGKNLIQEGNLMLAWGRHYGLIGRNGTGGTGAGFIADCQRWRLAKHGCGYLMHGGGGLTSVFALRP